MAHAIRKMEQRRGLPGRLSQGIQNLLRAYVDPVVLNGESAGFQNILECARGYGRLARRVRKQSG